RDEVRVTLGDARAELVPEPDVVPSFAASLQGETVALQLAEAGERAASLRWASGDGTAELVGRLTAAARDARIAVTLDARAAGLAPVGAAVALEADITDVVAQNVPSRDLVLGVEGFDGSFAR